MARYRPSLLAAQRKEAGLTRTEVAYRLGMAEVSLIEWERGRRRPSVELIGRLADLYGCSVNAFYDRSGVASCLTQ